MIKYYRIAAEINTAEENINNYLQAKFQSWQNDC